MNLRPDGQAIKAATLRYRIGIDTYPERHKLKRVANWPNCVIDHSFDRMLSISVVSVKTQEAARG